MNCHKKFHSAYLYIARIRFLNRVTNSYFREMKSWWFHEILTKRSKHSLATCPCALPVLSTGTASARQGQVGISHLKKGQIIIRHPGSWKQFRCLFWVKDSLTVGGKHQGWAPRAISLSPAHNMCTPASKKAVQPVPSLETSSVGFSQISSILEGQPNSTSFKKFPPCTSSSGNSLDLTWYHTI